MEGEVRLNSRFSIQLRASYALNYLVYLQNAIWNKRVTKSGRTSKFPYLNCDDWHLKDDNFEVVFADVWEEMLGKLADDAPWDHNGIAAAERNVYMKLFRQGREGELGYDESQQSFNAWYGGYWGQYAIERQVDNDLVNEMFTRLKPHFESNKLTIIVLYDEPIFIRRELKTPPLVYVVSFHQLRHSFDQTVERIIRG